MPSEPNQLHDGYTTLQGGMDGGQVPSLIAPTQAAQLINTTCRGGFAQSRPGWQQRTLSYLDSEGLVDATLQTNFEDGRFQGATAYYSLNGITTLVAHIGGRVFRIKLGATYDVQDMSIATDLNANNLDKTWFAQAAEYLVIQNGQARPLIYNGASLRRSAHDEVPVGTVTEYGMGRLWVALADGISFVAGDIMYGPSGTASNAYRDAVLKFTENTFFAEGGSFGVPVECGRITAMRFVANLDTSLGQGPLQVFTQSAAFSVNTPLDRATWKDQEYPLQTISLLGYGATSQDSTTLVNGDIWFRSTDGIRSFQIARREHGMWTSTPLSREVDSFIAQDDTRLLSMSSSGLFDNRLLVTTGPQRSHLHGVYHTGLVALDFDRTSAMFAQDQPSYDGMWTGLRILQILRAVVNNVERCFIFVLSTDDKIELWELSRADRFDSVDNAIMWQVDSRRFGFASTGWGLLQLETGDLWLDRIAGTVSIAASYRSDETFAWQTWGTAGVCAAYCAPALSDASCAIFTPLQEQYRARIRLPAPSDACDAVTNKPYRRGFEMQTRLVITGAARILRHRVTASTVPEDYIGACTAVEACASVNACNDSPLGYVTVA